MCKSHHTVVFLCLTSLNMITSRSIHAATNDSLSNGWVVFHYVCVWERVCVCIHITSFLFIRWWAFRLFPYLTTVNSAAVNMHASLWIKSFLLFRYMPRSGIAGSYGNSVFSSIRNFLLFSGLLWWLSSKESVCNAGVKVKWKSLSHVWLFAAPWTKICLEFSRPGYWNG